MRVLIMTAVVVLMTGCGGRVTTDHRPGYDFSAVSTWAWADPRSETSDDVELDSPLLRERFEAAVSMGMTEAGLQSATPETAAVLVRYYITEERQLVTESVSLGFGVGTRHSHLGAGTRVVSEDARSKVVIDLIDRASGKMIWRGLTRAYLRTAGDPQRQQDQFNDLVTLILSRYPPL